MASISPDRWAAARLYRKLLKMYIRKFDTDHDTIVRAWRQTKYEFWFHRKATPDQVPLLLERGERAYETILGGIVPLYNNPNDPEGRPTAKYSAEMLKQTANTIDPITPEEFLRRNYQKIDPVELKELQAKLVAAGRWKGPLEFSPDDVPKIKVKRKVKCTDPDD